MSKNSQKDIMFLNNLIRNKYGYNPETGVIYFKDSALNLKHLRGSHAGSIDKKRNYIILNVRINGKCKLFLGHRIAWFLYYGEWPKNIIDHINGNPSDNRIVNLREATASQNSFNSKKRSDNTSTIKGISWDKSRNKWEVYINLNSRKIHIGRYKDLEEAKNKLRIVREELHKEFSNHG